MAVRVIGTTPNASAWRLQIKGTNTVSSAGESQKNWVMS
jgi:hypothetical protein